MTPWPVLTLLLAALLFVPRTALAQEEVCGEFSESDLVSALDRMDKEMAAVNLPAAWRSAIETRKELRCLDTLIEPHELARLAHAMAFLTYLDQQDEATAAAWARLATALSPKPLLPLKPPPTYAAFLADLPKTEARTLDGGLAKVKKGAIFMDGYVLAAPKASTETPHFVQEIDNKGQRIDAWWQDGVAFRDELLATPGSEPPRWAVAMSPSPSTEASVEVAEAEAEPKPDAPPPVTEETHDKGWISKAPEQEWMPNCPWAGKAVHAEAEGDFVVVNGQTWNVADGSGMADFQKVLADCHAWRAERSFTQWRKARHQSVDVNTGQTQIDSLVHLVGGAGTAIAAEVARKGLIKALEDPDRQGDEE